MPKDLTFKEAALSSFAFLTEVYGFECVKTTQDWLVEYRSGVLKITLCYDSYSSDVDLTLSRLEERYSLAELMLLLDVRFEWGGTSAQASTSAALRKVVEVMGTVVRHHAADLLDGDGRVFDRLDEQCKRLQAQAKLDEICRKADAAWRSRDYVALIRLLQPVQGSLSPHETKRLEYAQSKVRLNKQ